MTIRTRRPTSSLSGLPGRAGLLPTQRHSCGLTHMHTAAQRSGRRGAQEGGARPAACSATAAGVCTRPSSRRSPAPLPAFCRYMADEARSLKAYGELPENSEGGPEQPAPGGGKVEDGVSCTVPGWCPAGAPFAGTGARQARTSHPARSAASRPSVQSCRRWGDARLRLTAAKLRGGPTYPVPSHADPACSPRERHGRAQRGGGRRERRLHRLRRHQR